MVWAIVFANNSLLFGQVVANAQGGFVSLNSYSGSVTPNAYGLQIHLYGPNINVANWSMMVRVLEPVKNGEGKIMDPSKISLRINNISGNGPTLQEIGTNNAPVPLSFVETPIFRNSQAPLRTGPLEHYKQMLFSFDVIIAGGSYLEALKSWSNYGLSVMFVLRDVHDQLISQSSHTLQMQLYPTDTPPTEPTYSMHINNNARDGILEFSSINDYVNGVSQTYSNGLSVVSNTPYAIQVKTLTPSFESAQQSMPVNYVSLQLSSGNLSGTIALSENPQSVLTGLNSTSQPRLFDIRYFTQPNDERMLKLMPDTYRATLIYTLIPQ